MTENRLFILQCEPNFVIFTEDYKEKGKLKKCTFDSEAGVRPVQKANLHSSPSICSVMPMSLVW
jgi:hypothetical protein